MKAKPKFRTPAAFRFGFMYFLEQQGCLIKFADNLGGFSCFFRYCRQFYRLFGREPHCFLDVVSVAFFWDETPEGHSFWQDISRRWIRFLNS